MRSRCDPRPRLELRPDSVATGWFNPRKDGPEMGGTSVGMRDAGRAAACGAESARPSRAVSRGAEDTPGPTTGTGAGAGSSDAPHIPQKRLPSGFSFPQRPQRTMTLAYSLRHLAIWMPVQRLGSTCKMTAGNDRAGVMDLQSDDQKGTAELEKGEAQELLPL